MASTGCLHTTFVSCFGEKIKEVVCEQLWIAYHVRMCSVSVCRAYCYVQYGVVCTMYVVVQCGVVFLCRAYYNETSLIRHSVEPENNVGLGGCWIMVCLLSYLCMVTVPHIMVGLERMLGYRGVKLARFHCSMYRIVLYICVLIQQKIKERSVHTSALEDRVTDVRMGENPNTEPVW